MRLLQNSHFSVILVLFLCLEALQGAYISSTVRALPDS